MSTGARLAADFMASARAAVAEHGWAPAAVDFDQATLAHRARVLSNLLTAATICGLTGTEHRVLNLIALKTLGFQNWPQERLTPQTIGAALATPDRTIRASLARLAALRLIDFQRDGKETRVCRVHPDHFGPAVPGDNLRQKLGITSRTPTERQKSAASSVLPFPPRPPHPLSTNKTNNPPSPQGPETGWGKVPAGTPRHETATEARSDRPRPAGLSLFLGKIFGWQAADGTTGPSAASAVPKLLESK